MEFGNKLKKLRIGKKETLHNVSMNTNIDMTLLSKIERGKRLPTIDQIKRLAEHFCLETCKVTAEITAEKIIQEYGINEVTYNAILLVKEKLVRYNKGQESE